MDKRTIALIAVALLTGQAQAVPIEAVGAFVSKLFKGGSAAKEAVVAGRAAEGGAAAKGVEHLTTGDAIMRTSPALRAAEPKPNMDAEPIAKSRKDADAYRALRASANKGDAGSMLRMSEMTSSGKVTDPGEPWHGYWMFEAARLGSQAATRKTHDECAAHEDRRGTDRWFDSACGAADGRSLYFGDKLPASYSPYRPDSIFRAPQPRKTP